MKLNKWTTRAGIVAGAAATAIVTMAGPALAAVNDSISAYPIGGSSCGELEYVDSGTYSDGNTRDDFFILHDYCADGYSTHGYVSVNGTQYASVRNANGASGAAVYFDISKNIVAGDNVYIAACFQNGASGTPFDCGNNSRISADG